jgi:hypothetical protein
MIIENNWLVTNIKSRLQDSFLEFDVSITNYPYSVVSFETACNNVAKKIQNLNKPIYIGYSGGADSEFVVRLFNTLNIPFTSITVKGPGNFYEYEYASYLYKELPEINKHIIEISERDYVTNYVYVTKKMNFSAPNFIPSYVAAKYAKSQNGIYITGDNVLDVGYAENNLMLVGFCEWDYYYDALIDENLAIPFFQYDLPIVRSVVDKMNISELSFFKNTLYQTSFRPKLYGHYKNEKIRNLINRMVQETVRKNPQKAYSIPNFLSMI